MNTKHPFLALGVLTAGLSVTASLTTAQKSVPPQPTEQQKLKERVDSLEAQLKEAQTNAERAALEKDYIERIQKQYESYYEKVLNTQTTTLTIVGLTLTIAFALAGLFSLKVFAERTKNAIDAAVTELEAKLKERIKSESERLREENGERIAGLAADLKVRSDFQFQFAQALASDADERYADGRAGYRAALNRYGLAKSRNLLPNTAAARTLQNLFFSFWEEDEPNYLENAKKELEQELYDDLRDELAVAAIEIKWLGPLVKERKRAFAPSV